MEMYLGLIFGIKYLQKFYCSQAKNVCSGDFKPCTFFYVISYNNCTYSVKGKSNFYTGFIYLYIFK